MDNLTFISSLAWPATVIIVLCFLKGPISKAIPLITKVKYKDIDIEFQKIETEYQGAATSSQGDGNLENHMLVPIKSLLKIAEVSPKVAVIEAGRSLKFEFEDSVSRFLSCSKSNVSSDKDMNIGYFQNNPVLIELGKLLKIREDLMDNPEYEVTEQNARKYIFAANKYCKLLKSLFPVV
ncbi:hypothetical protein A1507_12655 [Methylomonas koyamae]|uniref:Uncharacterized protein n=1 Tax=Methylomonas koyamae TaxID=702114 RepID=A0A177NC98_9GAMM|nr:hypothetical protein [Methylomonas koyamae]OAI15676.1 hypothetical protein A1507_12655 [Methylomonas koyamae]